MSTFRVNPYLQQPSSDGMYFTWFTEEDTSGELTITGPGLESPLTFTSDPILEPVLSYTAAEENQEIDGLEQGSWLLGNENYKHTVDVSGLLPDRTYEYTVTVGDRVFESSFETAPTTEDWDQVRFVGLSDSETEPRGRVRRRDWQEGAQDDESVGRPSLEDSLWAETLGVSGDRLNYPLTENVGYRNNLEIINSREPDFMVMPGDLVQGGGYQPGWDEFFRHNAGEFDSGLSDYPILPALGNWENFGALNGGYGTDEAGRFGPKLGHDKFHAYFDAPPNGTPEHQDNYYRIDYGPITILTLDSSNGEPDDSRDNYGGEGQPPKISGREFTEPGTDTQENFTREQYEAAGGTDLADFNPGSPQWNWVIEQLEEAREQGQIIFAQFHHVPYSSGTHGLPMNHEESSGQGGTPLRKYHALFEEYEVAAVFSGHSEMFERSFVDEDGDGIGVNYYDVGVAGDGMRGERQTDDGELLSYNQFSQWTADQSEPERWEEVDGVLQNVAGGKHYGHLEINLEQTGEGSAAEITLTPVYSFPILDSNYELVDTERRVYGDEITIRTNADGTLADSGIGGLTQINTFETGFIDDQTPLTIPSTDPAGIAFYEPSGNLFIADSEIAELDIFPDTISFNLFEVTPDGQTLVRAFDLTDEATTGAVNDEPTGIAYDAKNDRFYISNDNTESIFSYELQGDTFVVEDEIGIDDFPANLPGITGDFEGISINPNTGLIYSVDGSGQTVVVLEYQNNSFQFVHSFELNTAEETFVSDPEGMAVDPATGNLLVVSEVDEIIAEFTAEGDFVREYPLGNLDPAQIATQGLTFAPPSDNSDQSFSSLYIADARVDNNDDPNERDGRVYEASLATPDDEEGDDASVPVFGSPEDDTLEAGIDFDGAGNLVFTGAGEDSVFASQGEGGNRIYSGSDNDELFAGTEDRLFGETGDDILDASVGSGNNRLYGGPGNDNFFLGSNDRLIGNEGSDRFFTLAGGNNLITGGTGADQFWIANAGIPDTPNTITDLTLGEDVIGIAGFRDLSFDDLSVTQEETQVVIGLDENKPLAELLGIEGNQLSPDNFVFVDPAV